VEGPVEVVGPSEVEPGAVIASVDEVEPLVVDSVTEVVASEVEGIPLDAVPSVEGPS